MTGWYGRAERVVEIVSGTAIWHHPARRVPIRYVLVRDVADELKPQGFLCTNLNADPLDILRWFVRRWSIEVTFAEVRRHLGVETQRQWTDADRPNHARASVHVLAGHALGQRPPDQATAHATHSGMEPEATADFQRCACRGQATALGPTRFSKVELAARPLGYPTNYP